MISIIVPVYNAEKFIVRCIESILNQTYKDIEVIAVNDGSTDKSGSILEGLAARDSRLKVINKENSGVSDTRNAGLAIASGEYIGFVDADDYVEETMYEKMLKGLSEYDADICCCGYFIEDENDYNNKINKSIDNTTVYVGRQDIFEKYLRQDYYTGIENSIWNKLFKRSVIGNITYSSYAYGEDVEFLINVFKNVDRMAIIDDILYHHVSNSDGASQKRFNNRMMELVNISDDLFEYIKGNYTEILPEAYAFRLTWYMVLIQVLYSTDAYKKNQDKIIFIKNRIKEEFNYLKNNSYTKRLDRYYMKAVKNNCVLFSIYVRKIILVLKK